MKRYEYRFEPVALSGFFEYRCEGHRELIEALAAEGWRFVGQIPTDQNGHGAVTALDLIFEREAEEA